MNETNHMSEPLRPMGVGDILDGTFRLYKRHFGTFLLIALAVYLPHALLTSGMQYLNTRTNVRAVLATEQHAEVSDQAEAYQPDIDRESESPGSTAPPGGDPVQRTDNGAESLPSDASTVAVVGMVVAGLLVLLVFVVVFPLCQGAIVHKVSAGYLGEPIGASESYRRASRRLIKLVLTNILAYLVIAIGFVLLVVPGVIFALWFVPVTAVVMLEGVGGTAALGRSRELMRGNLGKGFVLMLLVTVLGFMFGMAMGGITALPWPHDALGAFVQTVAQALILPVQLAPLVLLYYDLRIRKEGFDIEQLARSVAEPPEPAGGTG